MKDENNDNQIDIKPHRRGTLIKKLIFNNIHNLNSQCIIDSLIFRLYKSENRNFRKHIFIRFAIE
ncbi:MAG: hypothetical protein AMS27_17355 [Bacteroides sp. SM23_62_1]|nr:MAG: hypothetical protein AMS27_17355 [Bacteroides sp. SM23_62_1]